MSLPWLRGLGRGLGGCLLAGAMAVPLGPTTTSQAVNQINSSAMRPLPSTAPAPAGGEGMIWVPPRRVHVPGQPGVVSVPGHWERRLPGTDEVHVPPLVIRGPEPGQTTTLPAGTRPPVEERISAP